VPRHKWTSDEDQLLRGLRDGGTPWNQIAQQLGIPKTNCLRRYNTLAKAAVEWDKEMDDRLLESYVRHRKDLWSRIEADLKVPWLSIEDRIFDLGKKKCLRK